MKHKTLFVAIISLLLLVSQSAAQISRTEFTYQGTLKDGANPANANYDFEFALFNSQQGGTQVGPTITRNMVAVANGIFTVRLDFGSVFPGVDRYLQIRVKPAGAGGLTALVPRQPVTAAPYSITAVDATDSNIARLIVPSTSFGATGTPIVNSGFITSAMVTSNGAGYLTPPTVTVNDVSGVGAVITATITDGLVTNLPVQNPGSGYSAGATLSIALPPSNASQTFVTPNIFTGVNTMNNVNNTFAGSFTGNGSGLTNVPGTLLWQSVAGTSQQAQPNTGYLATNADIVTITLPASPNIGNIVRVSGAGAGGWKLAQNAGQIILAQNIPSNAPGTTWTPRESNRNWTAIASSADGSKLAAVPLVGTVYTSADSGATWTSQTNINRVWDSTGEGSHVIASSADGTKLVAVPFNNQIVTSTDSGVTWTPRELSRSWRSVASSADGNKLVAVVYSGNIFTSINSGMTWTPRDTGRFWWAVASSADGNKLVAVVKSGQIYTSTDAGVTWSPRGPIRDWRAVASSSDGSKLAAVVNGGQIHTSSDSGVTWTPRESSRIWYGIASSADGSKLVAVVQGGGQIYTSTDSGSTWVARESSRDWRAAASSADGSKLGSVALGDRIYMSTSYTSPGTAGFMQGSQYSAVELLYIGNGQFVPLSHSGTITVN